TIARLCKDFKVQAWARDVGERSALGQASEVEREALFRYLTAPQRKLSQKTWDYLRRLPVLRDHRGEWIAPSVIMLRKASGAAPLEQVLHHPARTYSHDRELAQRFRFRTRVTGDDLFRYAEIVATQPLLAEDFEAALGKLKR